MARSRRIPSRVQWLLVGVLLLAMVPLQPAIPAAAGSGDDEFSSSFLGNQWHWVREDSTHWSLIANPGSLRIMTQATDLAGTTNTVPLLLQDAPSGDFALTTHLHLTATQNSQQAGLLVSTDDDNYVRLTYGYHAGSIVTLGKEHNGTYQSVQATVPATGSPYLQLVRLGQQVVGYVSLDGQTWSMVGQYSDVSFTPNDVGLVAFNGVGSAAASVAADFDFFHEQAIADVTSTADDEFSSSTLDSKWQWVREDPTHWSLTALAGAAQIVTQAKDIVGATNTAPLLLQAAPPEDFDITTRMTLSPTQNYQQGGLVVYSDDDNYLRLTYGYMGGLHFEFGKEIGSSFTWQQHAVPPGSSFYLRIRKVGQTFTGAYSTDGSSWTDVAQYTSVPITIAKVGLLALSGTTVPEIPADFDFFHVDPFPIAVAVESGNAPVSGTTNVYDALGRLAAVIDPASDTAVYHYDAVGNLLSISRQSSSQVAIIQLTPASGAIGRTVTIDGTGFSSNPSEDAVSFNGTAATVTAASATQLTVAVPSGATTGPLTVTTPVGSATSTTDFTVTSGQAPSITDVSTATGSPGTSVTITGANFADAVNDVVAFNGIRASMTSASATSLTVIVPHASSGPITVATPDGTATSSTDFIIPPAGFGTGDILTTGRTAIGQGQTVTIGTANKIGLVLFDGTQGQQISLGVSGSTLTLAYISILNPDGSTLGSRHVFGSGSGFVDTQTLPETGTYAILIDPDQSYTGHATVTPNAVQTNDTGTIVINGDPVYVNMPVPGENASLTFSGTQGQQISLGISGSTITFGYLSILKPDGSALINRYAFSSGSGFVDTQTLPATGTYTIFIDPDQGYTGHLTLNLYEVPVDDTGTVVIDGGPVNLNMPVPGENASLTFAGTQDQQILTAISGSTITFGYLSILKPDGSTLINRHAFGSGNNSIGATTLPTTGTYTVLIDPDQGYVGHLTLSLSSVSGFMSTQIVLAAAPYAAGGLIAESDAGPAPDTANAVNETDEPETETWTPDAHNRTGDWRSGRGQARTLDAAVNPLQDGPGVTAVSGQVLLYNGRPLRNATITIDDQTTQTDRHGQFLLSNLTAGHHILIVDGRSANQGNRSYALFQIGVDLTTNQTTVLPYTIWMPRLDTANAQSISDPTSGEVVLTTPTIPGLEVHIPAGSTLTDTDGNPATSLGITAIPTGQPPFPLPLGVQVPIYFTVQPAGTTIVPDGAYIVYPNYTGEAPGSRVDFWHYDPQTEGWYIYGQGTVTPDGTQIVPDPDVRIYEFTGAMIGSTGNPPSTGPAAGGGANDGDPVDLGTGLFVLNKTVLALPDTLPLALTRTYRPGDNASRSFGVGSSDQYDMFLWSNNNFQDADLVLPDGSRIHYVRTSPGTGYQDAVYEHTATPTIFYKSILKWVGTSWDLTLTDGTVYNFGEVAPLQSIRDRYGNTISITRTNGTTGNIT